MLRKRNFIVLFLYIVFVVGAARFCFGETETENKIREAIESMENTHPYQLSVFYIEPRLFLDSGYNSNALNSSVEEIGDYYASVAPGGGFAVKLGRRGYVELTEDLNFLYYNELEQLRDIAHATGLKLVTGSRKTLIELNGFHSNKQASINSEFDVPADQTSTSVQGSFTIGLRPSTDLSLISKFSKNRYEPIEGIQDPISPPSDHEILEYTVSLAQAIREWLSVNVTGTTGTAKFQPENQPEAVDDESKILEVLGGVGLSARRFAGSASIGFGRIEKSQGEEDPKDNLLIETDVTFLFSKSIHFGFHALRKHQISAFVVNGFSLTSEYGVSTQIHLGNRFIFETSYTYGKNDFDEEAIVDGEVVRTDEYTDILAVLKYRLVGALYFNGGIQKYDRDSNVDILNKDHFIYIAGLSYDPFAETQ